MLTRRQALSIGLAFAAAICAWGTAWAQQGGTPLPEFRGQSTGNVALIVNSDFENPEDQAWRLNVWPPRPETSVKAPDGAMVYSTDQPHTGDYSLRIDLTTIGEDENLLAQQSFGADVLAPHDGKRVRMSAWMWVESGPPGFQGILSIRQWGPPGAPPVSHGSVDMPGVQAEWVEAAREFDLRVGETTRGDITVGMRQVADLETAPVVFVDDVRLEVLQDPALSARLLCGRTLFAPDDVLPVKVTVAADMWEARGRNLRWDVTGPDGRASFGGDDMALADAGSVVEIRLPDIADGEYALRLALGAGPGERDQELLLPFRRAAGPFAANQE